jgi:hypothetical protein
MKQLKISLSDDLRARLDAAASKSGNSVAEEIRQRLDHTFELDDDKRDPLTEILVDDVRRLTDEIEIQAGVPWHADLRAHETLQALLNLYLETNRDALKESPSSLALDPSTLARAIFQNWTRFMEMRRAWDEIAARPAVSLKELKRFTREAKELSKRFGRTAWTPWKRSK